MDVQPYAVAAALRSRAVDVITAQEDGAREWEDSALLDRASDLGRVLVTQDEDLLREASRRNETAVFFAGIIYAHQLNVTIGDMVRDLELVALIYEPDECVNQMVYLPLK
jgi:predicted nuclease of predicted toxin-antitoxin system